MKNTAASNPNRIKINKVELRAANLIGYEELMLYIVDRMLIAQPIEKPAPKNYTDRKIISFRTNRVNIPQYFLKTLKWGKRLFPLGLSV